MLARLLLTALCLTLAAGPSAARAQEPADGGSGSPTDTSVLPLPDLAVVVDRARHSARLEGFHERSRGSVGRFVKRDEIEAIGSRRTTDLLRRLPGVRVTRHRWYHGLERIEIGRAPPGLSHPCGVELYVDGFHVPEIERFGYRRLDLDLPSPDDVEGIEVYTGTAGVPVEFRALNARCGVIVMWTRDGGRASAP